MSAFTLTVERFVERQLSLFRRVFAEQCFVDERKHGEGCAKSDVGVPLMRFASNEARDLKRVERLHGSQDAVP